MDTNRKRPTTWNGWQGCGSAAATLLLAACIAFGGLIGCDSGTRDKLGRLLGGGTAEQDQEQALLEQEKLWDIEELAQNRYGSVTLVYSPHDARVDMRLYKYAKDCTSSAGSPDALLECLKKPFDYTAAAEIQSIDNASLHLNRDAREIIESIPMQDVPIQEGNDALTMFWAYELQVEISREGYETQKFHFTGDRTRVGALGEDWQTRYWDMKGPDSIWSTSRVPTSPRIRKPPRPITSPLSGNSNASGVKSWPRATQAGTYPKNRSIRYSQISAVRTAS